MKKAPLPLLENGKLDLSQVSHGILLLTFDDGRFETWLPQMALFEKFNARATFFYDKEITPEAAESMKILRRAGHSVGFHTTTHKDAVDIAPETYYTEYILPQIRKAEESGVKDVCYFAYPNNRHSEEFDSFLSAYFKRFRAGAGIKAPKGFWIADFDEPYTPLEKLQSQKVMGGCGIGPFYESTLENLDAALEKAAVENKAITFFSHAVLSEAKGVHISVGMLEKMLEKASSLGMVIAGFDELP